MTQETNRTSTFRLDSWNGDLNELKEWVDKQVAAGKTTYDYEVDWGYYDDVDGITLVSTKRE